MKVTSTIRPCSKRNSDKEGWPRIEICWNSSDWPSEIRRLSSDFRGHCSVLASLVGRRRCYCACSNEGFPPESYRFHSTIRTETNDVVPVWFCIYGFGTKSSPGSGSTPSRRRESPVPGPTGIAVDEISVRVERSGFWKIEPVFVDENGKSGIYWYCCRRRWFLLPWRSTFGNVRVDRRRRGCTWRCSRWSFPRAVCFGWLLWHGFAERFRPWISVGSSRCPCRKTIESSPG